jgi:hypothetical protein
VMLEKLGLLQISRCKALTLQSSTSSGAASPLGAPDIGAGSFSDKFSGMVGSLEWVPTLEVNPEPHATALICIIASEGAD